MSNTEQLVNDNLQWAADVASSAARKLPPSLDIDDLRQEARIALWRAAEKYDPSTNVPFRAFAWMSVRGAVFMCARRRHYKSATMEELPAVVVDHSPNPEQQAIARELESLDSVMTRQREWLIGQLGSLSPSQAYLVRRAYLDGVGVAELAALWKLEPKEIARRINRAVRHLRDIRKDAGEQVAA